MIFTVENLGIIEKAEVDLSKDLILLCGQNNTGKSFLAYGIYHFLTLSHDYYSMMSTELFPPSVVDYIEQKIKGLQSNLTMTINLSKFLAHFDLKKTANHLIAKYYLFDLDKFFAFSNEDAFSSTQIALDFSDAEIIQQIESTSFKKYFYYFYGQKLTKTSVTLAKYKQSMNLIFKFESVVSSLDASELEKLTRIVLRKLGATLFEMLFHFNAYIAPAERSAINIFSQELSLPKNKTFDNFLKYHKEGKEIRDLVRRHTNRYSQPIQDNLEIAAQLVTLSKVTSDFSYLADELERNILKGKITISKTGEVNYIPDHAPQQNLGVHLTASLVKSLSNLVFYFRHLAKAGDYIIIDEPELNLHPDNQTLIARFLGRLINEGFKIITSTHSNYIIREINNLIMLTQPSEKTADLIKKYGYMTNQLINPTQVAGYLFKNNHSCPQSIEITEMGLGIETIDQVITGLNESSQEIYLSLFNGE